jgi:hypothetical protein
MADVKMVITMDDNSLEMARLKMIEMLAIGRAIEKTMKATHRKIDDAFFLGVMSGVVVAALIAYILWVLNVVRIVLP